MPSLISCTDTDVDYDTPITKSVVSLLFILRYSCETEVEAWWTWCLVSWTFDGSGVFGGDEDILIIHQDLRPHQHELISSFQVGQIKYYDSLLLLG